MISYLNGILFLIAREMDDNEMLPPTSPNPVVIHKFREGK